MEDIGVAYTLVGVSSSVMVIVDMAGVGGSKECIENGRKRGSGMGELRVGDFGKSPSFQVPGFKATGKSQVAVNVMPCPLSKDNQSISQTNFKRRELSHPCHNP